MISDALIEDLFNYHPPTKNQILSMEILRDSAKSLARVVNEVVPDGADKSAAIRLLRQCVQISNAGIILNGKA